MRKKILIELGDLGEVLESQWRGCLPYHKTTDPQITLRFSHHTDTKSILFFHSLSLSLFLSLMCVVHIYGLHVLIHEVEYATYMLRLKVDFQNHPPSLFYLIQGGKLSQSIPELINVPSLFRHLVLEIPLPLVNKDWNYR